MPIEDPGAIDLIVKGELGNAELLITDSGSIDDPERRLEAYQAKLKTYQHYIFSGQLVKDHPEFNEKTVKIVLVTPVPATKEMEAAGAVVAQNSGDAISVEQRIFKGKEERDSGDLEEKKEEDSRLPENVKTPEVSTDKRRSLLIYYRTMLSPEKCRLLRIENGRVFADKDKTLTEEELAEELESLKSDIEMLGIWKPAAGCLVVVLAAIVLTVIFDWKFLFLLLAGYAVFDVMNRRRRKNVGKLWDKIAAQMEERRPE